MTHFLLLEQKTKTELSISAGEKEKAMSCWILCIPILMLVGPE